MHIWILIIGIVSPFWIDPSIQSLGNTRMTGTLCSLQGGPSAVAAGQIRLSVSGSIYTLHYEKPYPHSFSNASCLDIGAIWTVRAQMTADREGTLIRADCTGKSDQSVRPAVDKVKQFLKSIEAQSFITAYGLLSDSWRSEHSLDQFTEQYRTLDLSFYRDHGRSGNCLEVENGHEQEVVTVIAGIDCAVFGLGGPVRGLIFSVKRKGKDGAWEIDGIRQTGVKSAQPTCQAQ